MNRLFTTISVVIIVPLLLLRSHFRFMRSLPAKPVFMDLPIAEAKRIKWERGRARYGATFEGDPIHELYDELIDALNYADEIDQQTSGAYLDLTVRLRRDLYAACERAQQLRKAVANG